MWIAEVVALHPDAEREVVKGWHRHLVLQKLKAEPRTGVNSVQTREWSQQIRNIGYVCPK
jgi:hypothetical protein